MDWLDGQARRRWLDEKNAQLGNALRYYAGPAAEPINALTQGVAAMSPGADMMDMMQSSADLMGSGNGWDAAKNAGWLGASALGMALPGNAGMVREAVEEAAPKGIRAYHGSPHDFDQFSMDKIGTGEGAQAYGHGLYFADNEGVARSYRDALAAPAIELDGRKVKPAAGSPEDIALAHLEDAQGAKSSAPFQHASKSLSMAMQNATPAQVDKFLAARTVLADWEAMGAKSVPDGRMYEVNIDANPDDFLDWDKPVSDPKLRDLLADKARPLSDSVYGNDRSVGMEARRQAQANPNLTGNGLHHQLSKVLGSKEAASQVMKEAGIPGIRYLDNGSRATGEGTSNYVVFDDKLVNILRKYGLMGAVGVGGMNALRMGEQEPET